MLRNSHKIAKGLAVAYSEGALAFSTIPADHQVRLEDRVSYLYLEKAAIRQDKIGVVAYSSSDDQQLMRRIQLPVSGLAVLMLGPGTSISAAAATSCSRAGTTVMFTGGGGVPSYSHSTPLTTSARWAIAQARLSASETKQRKAAVILYSIQLGLDLDAETQSISVMRGLEGQYMKTLYKNLAKKHNIKNFRRQVTHDDPINQGLNLANSILYGCAASACAALGINPALGIIHRGDARSLLFDLADLYKPTISIPAAFECSKEDDHLPALRRQMRSAIYRKEVLKDMLNVLMKILEPHLPERIDDRLIAGRGEEVPGHTQYGKK